MWNFTWLQVMITINIFIILVLSFVCGFFNKDLGLRNSATTVQCRCFYVWFANEKKLKTKRRIMSSFLICALKFISCLNLMKIHKHNQESVVKSAKFCTLKLLCDVAWYVTYWYEFHCGRWLQRKIQEKALFIKMQFSLLKSKGN